MYSLTYTSTASSDLTEDDLKALLNKAKFNNSRKDISGCLIYYNKMFVQILEGEKQIVEDLFSKIKLDPRHKDINVSRLHFTGEKIFSRWSMGYIDHNAMDDKLIKELFKSNLITYSKILNRTSQVSEIFWTKVKDVLSS